MTGLEICLLLLLGILIGTAGQTEYARRHRDDIS